MATLQNLGVLKYRDKDGNWKPLPVVLQSSGGGGGGGTVVTIDTTLSKPGQAADAKAAGDAIGKKLDKAQGVENAGMILGVDESGNVAPEDKPAQALAGSAAPTTATAGVVGQEYYVIVDNAVTEMYVCTSALIGSYTWDKVEFGGGSGGSGWNTSQVNLLITILKNCVYITNQTANIDALFSSLTSTGTLDIEKVGSSLIIRALSSTPTQSGSTLSIA